MTTVSPWRPAQLTAPLTCPGVRSIVDPMVRSSAGLAWCLYGVLAVVCACGSDRRGGGDDDDDDDGGTPSGSGIFTGSGDTTGGQGAGSGQGTTTGNGSGASGAAGAGNGGDDGDSSGTGSGSQKEAQCAAYGQIAVDCCTAGPEYCPTDPDGWEQFCLNGYDDCPEVFDCIVAKGCSEGDCGTCM